MKKITVPDVCLIVLVGPSSAGKTTFARQHFAPSQIVSSDQCRLMVADDENDQAATAAAFELVHFVVSKRLESGRLTVVDATNLLPEDRRPLLSLARAYHVPAVAVVLDVSDSLLAERNAARGDRTLPAPVLRTQVERARRASTSQLSDEGFGPCFTLDDEEIGAATVERVKPPTDLTGHRGPFDIIGDVHGCLDELVELLTNLGYDVASDRASAEHPEGRTAVFVGDLVDRGPDTPGVLQLVMGMARASTALCVPGNHESRLVRAVRGGEATTGHGLAESLEQLAASAPELREDVIGFLEGLPSHVVLDGGQLVVAHAGLPAHMQNRDSPAVRWFTQYGDTTGETDEFGRQVRYPWARDYAGDAAVVYGHTPVKVPEWVNNTICVDTGCVYGGRLTALRYPERELVSVPAARVYYERAAPSGLASEDAVVLSTRLAGDVSLPAPSVQAAEEEVRNGGLDLHWLVYVTPAVPAGPVTARGDLLEHPEDAFATYAEAGAAEVVCEYFHAGTPAVAVVCQDAEVAARRFGVELESAPPVPGVLYTATGLPAGVPAGVASDGSSDTDLLEELHRALDAADLWAELATDWVALEVDVLAEQRLAPRTVLAAESGVWVGEDRLWHLGVADRLHTAAPQMLIATRSTCVTVADVRSRAQGIAWWQDLVTNGGAGMVIRPLSAAGPDGVPAAPPGLLCRGQTYLQAQFGNDYAAPENLLRLRDRDVAAELAASHAASVLGVEALERFVKGEPSERVHECCFGALAASRIG